MNIEKKPAHVHFLAPKHCEVTPLVKVEPVFSSTSTGSEGNEGLAALSQARSPAGNNDSPARTQL